MQRKHAALLIIAILFAAISTAASAETLTPKITPAHIDLYTMSQVIYLIPPDNSFKTDTTKTFLGFNSSKYNSTMKISFAIQTMPSEYEQINAIYKILIFKQLQINDISVSYYKLTEKDKDAKSITWLMFCESDFFKFYIINTYDSKHDKALAKKIEKTYKNIIVQRNPDVMPNRNSTLTGNFELLPLQFVQLMSVPIAYFTEDGSPVNKTHGSKYVALASPPISALENREKSILAIESANAILALQQFSDSIIVERLSELEFCGGDGICIEGTLAHQQSKRFIFYFTKAKTMFYGLFAVCNKDDAEQFFQIISAFEKTVIPTQQDHY
jgi:hypothetical protein